MLAPEFAADGDGQLAAGQRGQRTRHLAVDRGRDAFRLARFVVDLDAVDQVDARLGRGCEGVDRAVAHGGVKLVEQHVAIDILVGAAVFGARQRQVVVPAGQVAAGTEHEALAFAADLVAAVAGFLHAVADAAEGVGQAWARQRTAIGLGQDTHRQVADADRVRRQHVLALRFGLHQLGEELVVGVELVSRAADETDLARVRIDLGVFHVVVAAARRPAWSLLGIHGGGRIASRCARVDPADRAARRQQARGYQRGALGARDIDVDREGIARHLRRQRGGQGTLSDEAALARTQAVELLEVEHAEHVKTIGREVAEAGAEAGGAFAGAAMLGARGGGGQVDARIVLAGDEIDHAADGVGAVDRRGAVLQYLDTLDRPGGDVVQVDAGIVAGGGEVGQAAAVEQYQCRRHAQAAHVGAVHAALARGAVRNAGTVRQGRRVGADVAHQFGRGGDAHLVDGFARNHFHRQRRFAVEPLDRGARDQHPLYFRFRRRGLPCRLRLCNRLVRQQNQCGDNARGQDGWPQGIRLLLAHALLPQVVAQDCSRRVSVRSAFVQFF
nr:hypothetical protein [Massilia sp. Se16.2.3]